MALEYVELNAQSGGQKVVTDVIDSNHVQVVKIMHGADGANDGLADNATPLPVTGAVTNAGTFAVQVNGDALTSLQLIDDAIRVEDAAEPEGTGLVMAGTVRRDTDASSAGTTGDNATLNTDSVVHSGHMMLGSWRMMLLLPCYFKGFTDRLPG
jgi:hypothetical protein